MVYLITYKTKVGGYHMKQSSSAYSTARSYLSKLTEQMKRTRQTRFPPIKNMAVDAGVSHVVMARAVGELQHEGVITVRQRRGIELSSSPAVVNLHQAGYGGGDRWHRLCVQLRTDLADGRFGLAPLPPYKELAARYAVSRKTLNKSLHALVAEGFLAAAGKTFRAAIHTSPAKGNSIVLFARSSRREELAVYSPRVNNGLAVLEQCCLARGMKLHIVYCSFIDQERISFPGWESATFGNAFDHESALGFMIWRLGMTADFTRDLAVRLKRLGKPIAVFCEMQNDLSIPGLHDDNLLRRYTTAGDFQAGAAVGRFLVARNHRRICCFADTVRSLWAQERLAGLRQAFSEAGSPDGVAYHMAYPDYESADEQWQTAVYRHLDPGFEALYREMGIRVPRLRHEEMMERTVINELFRYRVINRIMPAMEESARQRRVTAWVGMNDHMAIDALNFLRRHETAVPEQVAVIGFDDSYDAASHQLTSYNFNGIAAMNRMVDFLLWPGSPMARSERGKEIEVEGFVHERATTGPR
jgi:DNA-binding LacI/PurR family transcriptional regulator/DNA-binding transcriptional regulator YhcF (GntR family)